MMLFSAFLELTVQFVWNILQRNGRHTETIMVSFWLSMSAHPDLKDRKRELITFPRMRTTTVLALAFLASSLLVSAQESDEANAVLQTERDLAIAYQGGDAYAIAQGVMQDYTLTSSTVKVTTRSDDIAEAEKNDP